MIAKKLTSKDFTALPSNIMPSGVDVDVCVCEECKKFYIYGEKSINGKTLSSAKYCPQCLTDMLLNHKEDKKCIMCGETYSINRDGKEIQSIKYCPKCLKKVIRGIE